MYLISYNYYLVKKNHKFLSNCRELGTNCQTNLKHIEAGEEKGLKQV